MACSAGYILDSRSLFCWLRIVCELISWAQFTCSALPKILFSRGGETSYWCEPDHLDHLNTLPRYSRQEERPQCVSVYVCLCLVTTTGTLKW